MSVIENEEGIVDEKALEVGLAWYANVKAKFNTQNVSQSVQSSPVKSSQVSQSVITLKLSHRCLMWITSSAVLYRVMHILCSWLHEGGCHNDGRTSCFKQLFINLIKKLLKWRISTHILQTFNLVRPCNQ